MVFLGNKVEIIGCIAPTTFDFSAIKIISSVKVGEESRPVIELN